MSEPFRPVSVFLSDSGRLADAPLPKPFFRKARGLWYVQLAGKQISLGHDQEAAFARYHELMVGTASAELPPSEDGTPLVAELADPVHRVGEVEACACDLRLVLLTTSSFSCGRTRYLTGCASPTPITKPL